MEDKLNRTVLAQNALQKCANARSAPRCKYFAARSVHARQRMLCVDEVSSVKVRP